MKVRLSGTANYFTNGRNRYWFSVSVEVPNDTPPNWQFPNRAFWIDVDIPDDFFWPPETKVTATFIEHDCEHPSEAVALYDSSVHCFRCRFTWHEGFPDYEELKERVGIKLTEA